MRSYVWYSPELNVIVLQQIMDGCRIAFEWGWEDLSTLSIEFKNDPLGNSLWMPLGEL